MNNSRYAIIDLGTNTFNLLIIELNSGSYKNLFNDKIAVKLGKDCIDKNVISEDAIERGIQALHTHLNSIKRYHVNEIYAIATSAIRSATNGISFVNKVKDNLGLTISVISGEKEADLIYYGVRQALNMGTEKSLIMDIGGGSTEFIIANDNQIFWKHSFNLGVSRLIEKFKPHDPIKDQEIVEIKNYLKIILLPLFEALNMHKVDTLIGSSGSFDTLADILLYKETSKFLPEDAKTYSFDISKFFQLHKQLLSLSYLERLEIKGMLAMRADMMVLGSIFIQFVLTHFPIRFMKLSTYALKEGIAWEIMNSESMAS